MVAAGNLNGTGYETPTCPTTTLSWDAGIQLLLRYSRHVQPASRVPFEFRCETIYLPFGHYDVHLPPFVGVPHSDTFSESVLTTGRVTAMEGATPLSPPGPTIALPTLKLLLGGPVLAVIHKGHCKEPALTVPGSRARYHRLFRHAGNASR
jgi:hypothetical protein